MSIANFVKNAIALGVARFSRDASGNVNGFISPRGNTIMPVDISPIGTIVEFPTSPGANWLECNGESYLRSEFPELAVLRPSHGFDLSVLTLPVDSGNIFSAPLWTGSAWLVTGKGTPHPYINYIFRSADGINWTKITAFAANTMIYGSVMLKSPVTGRILIVRRNGTNCYYSDDDGLTWTAGTPLPAGGTPASYDHQWGGDWTPSQGFIFVKGGTNELVHSIDGITWTSETLLGIPAGFNSNLDVKYIFSDYWGSFMYLFPSSGWGEMAGFYGDASGWDFNTYGSYSNSIGFAVGSLYGTTKPVKHPTDGSYYYSSTQIDSIYAQPTTEFANNGVMRRGDKGGFASLTSHNTGIIGLYGDIFPDGAQYGLTSEDGKVWERVKLNSTCCTSFVGGQPACNGSYTIGPYLNTDENKYWKLDRNPNKFFIPAIDKKINGIKSYIKAKN